MLKMILLYWLSLSLLSVVNGQYLGPICDTTTYEHTIIDIKSSVARSAKLINGTMEPTLGDCVRRCCDIEQCDLAVFKNKGTSAGNRNCYLVECRLDENCVLVGQTYFTAISLKKGVELTSPPDITSAPDDITDVVNSTATVPNRNTIELTSVTMSSPSIVTNSVLQHNSLVVFSTTSVLVTSSTSYTSSVIITPTSSSSTKPGITTKPTSTSPVNKISNDKETVASLNKLVPTAAGPSKEATSDEHRLCGNANCNNSKVAGLVVACLLVGLLLVFVVLIVVKKSWDRHRSRKYKRIDYLIDGMYS